MPHKGNITHVQYNQLTFPDLSSSYDIVHIVEYPHIGSEHEIVTYYEPNAMCE